MRLVVPAEVEEELRQTVEWYDLQGPALGDQFLSEFRHAISRVIAYPLAWPKVSRRSRRCRMNRFPYGVVFQIRGHSILVVAVMHLARRPGYWKARERS
jgi:hypothetical protein